MRIIQVDIDARRPLVEVFHITLEGDDTRHHTLAVHSEDHPGLVDLWKIIEHALTPLLSVGFESGQAQDPSRGSGK